MVNTAGGWVGVGCLDVKGRFRAGVGYGSVYYGGVMTILACKYGLMVADRRHVNADTGKAWARSKITNFKDYYLVSVGNVWAGGALERWFMAGAVPSLLPKIDEDIIGLSDARYGVVDAELIAVKVGFGVSRYKWGCAEPDVIGMGSCAFGSGADYALPVLMQGGCANEAVSVACGMCDGCGHGRDCRYY